MGDSLDSVDDTRRRLYRLAGSFRDAIEDCRHNFTRTLARLKDFPVDCCDRASVLLALFLHENGFRDVACVFADCNRVTTGMPNRHTWVRVERWNIDITADQFNGKIDPVLVTDVDDNASFHATNFVERYTSEPLAQRSQRSRQDYQQSLRMLKEWLDSQDRRR